MSWSWLIVAWCGLGVARAQSDEPLEGLTLPTSELGKVKRESRMEANVRFRYLTLPDSILDVAFYDSDVEGANPYKRPSARAFAVGAEYVLRPEPVNWVFYFEYVGSMMSEGYWDDIENSGAPDHENGRWWKPEGLGAFAVGANGMRELALTSRENNTWLSLLLGGGLGLAFVNGEILEWNPGSDDANEGNCPGYESSSAYVRKDVCDADRSRPIPAILPMVDLSASLKVNLGDRTHIRVEGGLHSLLFTGVSVGTVF